MKISAIRKDTKLGIGPSSPSGNSGVIVLSEKRTGKDAADACATLGEQLWSPELNTSSIQSNLNYLVYQKKIDPDNAFWIGGGRSISGRGVVAPEKGEVPLPVLCTQSAPFSTDSVKDTSEKWRISVQANNENLVG